MTELDRVGNSDNFNFRGFPLFLQVCEKGSQAMRKKDGMFAGCLSCYISVAKFRVLPVCLVIKNKLLMLIKV